MRADGHDEANSRFSQNCEKRLKRSPAMSCNDRRPARNVSKRVLVQDDHFKEFLFLQWCK
jgi:hypothetical protein